MRYSDIRTLQDYVGAVTILQQGPRGDDYHERINELSELASRAIFKAKKLQLTGAGHREYRVNFRELAERVKSPDKFIPVILLESMAGYTEGSVVNIPAANHLEDEVAV